MIWLDETTFTGIHLNSKPQELHRVNKFAQSSSTPTQADSHKITKLLVLEWTLHFSLLFQWLLQFWGAQFQKCIVYGKWCLEMDGWPGYKSRKRLLLTSGLCHHPITWNWEIYPAVTIIFPTSQQPIPKQA